MPSRSLKVASILIPKDYSHKRVKGGVLRDKAWLKAIASQEIPCCLTGRYGRDGDQIVPMHVGTAGKGIKSPDNEVLPVLDSLHKRSHGQQVCMGFHTMMIEALNNDSALLRDFAKAYAREQHMKWKSQ